MKKYVRSSVKKEAKKLVSEADYQSMQEKIEEQIEEELLIDFEEEKYESPEIWIPFMWGHKEAI